MKRFPRKKETQTDIISCQECVPFSLNAALRRPVIANALVLSLTSAKVHLLYAQPSNAASHFVNLSETPCLCCQMPPGRNRMHKISTTANHHALAGKP